MSCSSCGCGSCGGNPCNQEITNTVECESLPSQIQNFTDQFFGTVVKTEVDGQITWTLPCNLDNGLTNNPRLEDEGLACYFLRLFGEGIIGLTGPVGPAGADGATGKNAYTVTTQSFVHPTAAAPNVQVQTSFNPAILEGLEVFIDTSGWYLVNATDETGSLFLTLVQALTGASGTITAGKLVLPTGPAGRSIEGPQGPQGLTGPQGPAGESFTATNTQFFTSVGTDYPLTISYAAVNLTAGTAEVNLADEGTYLITAVVAILGKPTLATSDVVSLKLRNTTLSVDVPAAEQEVSALVDTQREVVTIHCRYATDSDNQVITLFGKCTTGAVVDVVSNRTVITAVRIA